MSESGTDRAFPCLTSPTGSFAAGGAGTSDPRQSVDVDRAGVPVKVPWNVLVPAPSVEGDPIGIRHPGWALVTASLEAKKIRSYPWLDVRLVFDPAHPVPKPLDHGEGKVADLRSRPGDFDLDR